MAESETCLVCGNYLINLSPKGKHSCYYCGEPAPEGSRVCEMEHYVCENCHNLPVNQRILAYCLRSEDTDPVRITQNVIDNAGVMIHGPEHHFLIPAVLLTAYLNFTGQTDRKQELLEEAHKRASLIPGGFCWTNGTCAAGIGVGTFVSLITKATALSGKEWYLSNLATAKALESIARSGGPRCCKRDTFIAIRKACEFLDELLQIKLPCDSHIICRYFSLNRECTREECIFYYKNYENGAEKT
ncbi:MAG: DUF5714 domain-containing protein [Bacteroidales bacterium]